MVTVIERVNKVSTKNLPIGKREIVYCKKQVETVTGVAAVDGQQARRTSCEDRIDKWL